MAATHNLRGTSHNSFRIGKGGPTFHQGEAAPGGEMGVGGDIYIRTGANTLLYQKIGGIWVSLHAQYQSKNIHYTSVNYTPQGADDVIFADTTSNAITVTLADVITVAGRTIVVKDWAGNSETNPITIQGESVQSIDGASSQTIGTSYESITLTSDGTNWFIV